MTQPLISITDISKTYPNGVQALAGVNLTIEKHALLCLLGSSGCGKSTLLRIIAGLEQPSTGKVVFAAAKKTPSIGYVFQDATLLPWRNALENVALPLELTTKTPKKQRHAQAQELLELVGLADATTFYPNQLSGGMKMRVSIARALITKPDILLLDEPFGTLDEITRQRLDLELLHIQAATKATIIFVTHNVYEAAFIASHIAIMSMLRPSQISDIITVPDENLQSKNLQGKNLSRKPRDKTFIGSKTFSNTVVAVMDALENQPSQKKRLQNDAN